MLVIGLLSYCLLYKIFVCWKAKSLLVLLLLLLLSLLLLLLLLKSTVFIYFLSKRNQNFNRFRHRKKNPPATVNLYVTSNVLLGLPYPLTNFALPATKMKLLQLIIKNITNRNKHLKYLLVIFFRFESSYLLKLF